jgi:hypothetical protein
VTDPTTPTGTHGFRSYRQPWRPGLVYTRRGCHRKTCGIDHDSAVIDLTRPSWCSPECYLADEDRPKSD